MEIDRLFRKTGKIIVALTVREVLDEQIAKKLAEPLHTVRALPAFTSSRGSKVMDGVELRTELGKQLRALHEKHDYWLMAVAASAIALCVHDTRDAALQYSQIPLGAAVIAWGMSFFAGCKRQDWMAAFLRANADYVRIKHGTDPLVGTEPTRIASGVETMGEILNDQSTKAATWGLMQFRSLVAGAIFYLSWHLIEMWHRTAILSVGS